MEHSRTSPIGLLMPMIVILWAGVVVWSSYGAPLWLDEGINLLQLAGNINNPVSTGYVAGNVYADFLDGRADIVLLGVHLMKADVHPPAPYILAELWTRVFGSSPTGLRALSTLLVAIGAIAFFSRHLPLSTKGRMVALGLVLAAPPILFAAGNIRGYGLAFCTLGLTFFFLHRALEMPKHSRAAQWMLAALIAAGVAALSHYFTMMVLGPAFFYALRKVPTTHRTRLAGTGFGGLVCLLLIAYLSHQMGARPGQFTGFVGFTAEGKALVNFLFGSFTWGQETGWRVVSMGIAVLGVWGLWKTRSIPHMAMHGWALMGFVLSIFALFWSADKSIALATDRYFAFALPSLAVGVAAALDLIKRTIAANATAATVALVAVAAIAVPGVRYGAPTVPWKGAGDTIGFSEAVQQNRIHGGVVVMPSNMWHVGHLFASLTQEDRVFLANTSRLFHPALQEAIKHPSFVMVPATNWDPWQQEILGAYEEQFRACGFKQETRYLWVRKRSGTPCTLSDPQAG